MKKIIILGSLLILSSKGFSQDKHAKKETAITAEAEHPTMARVYELDKIFRAFVSTLHGTEREKSKNYLSSMTLKQVTAEQLIVLSESIKKDDELLIYSRKLDKDINGYGYDMVQYRYKSDKEPSMVLQITFDAESKILSINANKPK